MAKTVKKLADEIGVSKTAIMKKIENLGLHSDLQKNGNQFVISETQERLIKSAFSEVETQTRKPRNDSEIENQIAFLQEEIRQKNEQIREAQEEHKRLLQIIDSNNQHLSNLEEMLKAEIFLKVQAENKVMVLEDKLAEPEQKKSWVKKFFKL